MSRIRDLSDPNHLPALDMDYAIARPALGLGDDQPPPRILLLYGSLRERSFSRLAVEEAARLLQLFGAETRIFNPSDLPSFVARATVEGLHERIIRRLPDC